MNTRLFGCWAVAALLATGAARAAGAAGAAEPDSQKTADEWRGRGVLAATPGVLLREQPNEQAAVVSVSTAGVWLDVKRSQGDWLEADWGWLRAADAVRAEQALEHFTAELARAETAFALIARSRAWLEKNEFDKALADVSEALRLEPNHARAYVARARIAAAQQRPDDVSSACERALAIDPRDPFALEMRARLRAEAGEYDRAIGDLDRAIESLPNYFYLWSGRGFCREAKGDFDQALADFTEAVRLNPLDTFSRSERAVIHLRRQEFDQALADAEAALRADPKFAKAIAIRGVVRAQQGKLDAAIGDLDESIRLNATDAVVFRNRGQIHFLKGRFDAAIGDFSQAIALDASDADAFRARSESWVKKGDYASAVIDITEYLRLRPDDANAYARRGWLTKDSDPDAATADFNTALGINARHAYALTYRAEIWRNKHEYAKALADLAQAIEIDPNYADAYWQRATLHSRRGEHRLAVDDYSAVLRIRPGDTGCLMNRSIEWSLSGNLEKALEDCRAALAIEPKNLMAYYYMAMAHSHAGQREKALEDFAAALRIDPLDDEIRLLRAYELFTQDKFDLALADLDEVIRHGKLVARAYNWRGYLWMQRRGWDEAMAAFDEAIRLEPNDADHWRMRADCWYGKKQFDKAIADADQALRLDPRSEAAASIRQRALDAKQDPSKADESQMAGDEISDEQVLTGLSDTEPAQLYRIALQGPEGLKLLFETFGPEEFGPDFMSVPARVPMFDETRMCFKVTGIPGAADAALYVILDPKPLAQQEIEILRTASPSITLTQADLDAALTGKDVTKILVLRRREGEGATTPEFEVLSSEQFGPKEAPIAAASRRGAVAATLSISKRQARRLRLLSKERMIAFCLRGPDGLTLSPETSAAYRPGPVPTHRVPAHFGFFPRSTMHWKLGGPPVASGKPVYALLTISSFQSKEEAALAQDGLTLTISKADLDSALAGQEVTRVVYRDKATEDGRAPRLETLSSAELEPSQDPLAEASKRGAVLATLKLSNEPFEAAVLQSEESPYGDEAVTSGLTDEQRARLYEVELQGPEGVNAVMGRVVSDEFTPEPVSLPARVPMLDGSVMELKLVGPDGAAPPVYALLTSKELPAEQAAALRAAKPALTLTKADLDSALAGRDVMKILVLRRHASDSSKQPEFELLSGADREANAGLVAAASRRGTVVAMAVFAKRPPLLSRLIHSEPLALRLHGPEGLTLTREDAAQGQFEGLPSPLPGELALPLNVATRFKLGGPLVAASDAVYALVGVAPGPSREASSAAEKAASPTAKDVRLPTDAFLTLGSELPLEFTKSDLEAALAGKRVTRVVYLPNKAEGDDAPRLEMLSSAGTESPKDVVEKASDRGIVLAILVLSQRLDDLPIEEFGRAAD